MDISKGLSQLLQNRGLSRSRLARDLDVHTSTVTNWLEGKAPSAENLSDICKYFGVYVDFLITGEQEKAPAQSGGDAGTEFSKQFFAAYGKQDETFTDAQVKDIAKFAKWVKTQTENSLRYS